MARRKLPLVVLVFLAAVGAGGWLGRQALAAELVGPSTPAAPGACSPGSGLFSAPVPVTPVLMTPALMTPVPSAAAAVATARCGCGAASCLGKLVGAVCGRLICAKDGVCSTPTVRCACILPP